MGIQELAFLTEEIWFEASNILNEEYKHDVINIIEYIWEKNFSVSLKSMQNAVISLSEIPDTNNDIFKVIVGMLVGSLSLVITTFVGKDPSEVENLKAKVESYEKQIKSLTIEKDKVEKMLRDYQSEVIEKLAIAGDNFDYGKKNKK